MAESTTLETQPNTFRLVWSSQLAGGPHWSCHHSRHHLALGNCTRKDPSTGGIFSCCIPTSTSGLLLAPFSASFQHRIRPNPSPFCLQDRTLTDPPDNGQQCPSQNQIDQQSLMLLPSSHLLHTFF